MNSRLAVGMSCGSHPQLLITLSVVPIFIRTTLNDETVES